MRRILAYIFGIVGAISACMGLYTLFTGDTTINILGGAMIPDSMTVSLTMNKEFAVPFLVVGVVLFLVGTYLLRH